MTKEIQEKIEAAAEGYLEIVLASKNSVVHNVFREGMKHILENPRDFGLVSLAEVDGLITALEFYASRTIYEKLNQFPGDNTFSECSDIAEERLKAFNLQIVE